MYVTLFPSPGRNHADGNGVVQYLPAWLPGAQFKRRAAEVKRMVREAARKTYELAERKSVSVTLHHRLDWLKEAVSSLARHCLCQCSSAVVD